ncbi:UBP-type zinc finger domain-containing protein [Geomicrobium sp. JCM 19037]|uniref:UBP-type zinc finger domain-containing protein n=1 Tax=Geomicrobium sp. JCM 19037 TaxID=1460634 RepID=UPI0035A37AB4
MLDAWLTSIIIPHSSCLRFKKSHIQNHDEKSKLPCTEHLVFMNVHRLLKSRFFCVRCDYASYTLLMTIVKVRFVFTELHIRFCYFKT